MPEHILSIPLAARRRPIVPRYSPSQLIDPLSGAERRALMFSCFAVSFYLAAKVTVDLRSRGHEFYCLFTFLLSPSTISVRSGD